MVSKSAIIESPCVKNCCLDKHDVCLGCGRTIDEIIRWGDSDNQEKSTILASAKKRRVNRAMK